MPGQLDKAATWPMWPSSPLTCATWLERTTWWLTAAGEAALGHVLAVPCQLLTTTAPPADTPAQPAVIPAAKGTYAEAAATPALDGATSRHAGGHHHQGPAEAPLGVGSTGGGGSTTQGVATWEERLDLSS